MLKKTITYEDYNGKSRTEDFYFYLNKAELIELEASVQGGLSDYIQAISAAGDTTALIPIFKKILLMSYGEKSLDGTRFMKVNDAGVPLNIAFSQKEAYSTLFMELATDDKAAAEFINGIMPTDLANEARKQYPEKFAALENN